MPRLLYLFSAINLVIGSSAFVLAGIVEPLARDLRVSVAAAGQATTAYAVGTAVLAPLLLLATGRWPRKRVLLLALGLFTLGNALSALSHPPGAAAGGARADGRRRGVRGRGRRHRRGAGGAGAARPGAVAGVPGHEPELRDRRARRRVAGPAIRLARPVWLAAACRRSRCWRWRWRCRATSRRRARLSPGWARCSARGAWSAPGRDAAVLHRDLQRLRLHRPGAAGAVADGPRGAVADADDVRPGRRDRHARRRLGHRPLWCARTLRPQLVLFCLR